MYELLFSKVLLSCLILYVKECILEYQYCFCKLKSTVKQLSIIGQLIEKKYEYRQDFDRYLWTLRKAYNSVYRESLYSIMEEFLIRNKLVTLTKMFMEGTKYEVRVDSRFSATFIVETG